MSWYHLEPQPRAYQGQSWLHVQEDTQTIPAGATRLFAGALIDVRPHTHDDDTIRPAFSRQTVEELAAKLDGTLWGNPTPNRNSGIAALSWSGDTLTIAHRAGTSRERVETIRPGDRGLYTIVFDAFGWRSCHPGRLTGLDLLDNAWHRLDLAQQHHGADCAPAAVLHRIAADSAVGLGDYLGELLPHLVPVDTGAERIPQTAAGMLAHAVTVAARHLCATGCRDLAAALGSPQTRALLDEQISQQLQPILDAAEQAEKARHPVDGNGEITCFTCDRKHPAATSRHLRYGWDCAACAGPQENWGGIQ